MAERALPSRRLLAASGQLPFDAWRAKADRTPY
jgi:hypothetical protein